MNILLIRPRNLSPLVTKIYKESLKDLAYEYFFLGDEFEKDFFKNKTILIGLDLNYLGYNLEILEFLEKLREDDRLPFKGSITGLIISNSKSRVTKSFGTSLVYLINSLGSAFPGRPLVEISKDFSNYPIKTQDPFNLCLTEAKSLVARLLKYFKFDPNISNILVVHSSSRKSSNTLALWDMVRSNLNEVSIEEINIRGEKILDCKGCGYETCKHFGNNFECFYGGLMVEKIYPAILKADGLVLLCPNYNDMLMSNMVALINRLSALYRRQKFFDKSIFAIIVSGYSGGESIAKQIISSLNINKSFYLPGNFSLEEIANKPLDIKKTKDITSIAKNFAEKIIR